VLSGAASRQTSVTDSFDRESFNSVEQTFTVVVVGFMVAHAKLCNLITCRLIINLSDLALKSKSKR
jgi:hypothetical protein